MSYSFGDIVLVSFPFTDQSGAKKRPAVVISSKAYNSNRRDALIMAITSQVRVPLSFGEALITDWQAAGLIKSSVFKPILASIEQALLIRKIGALSPADSRVL